MTVLIRLRAKHRLPTQPKQVKGKSAGNSGTRTRPNRVSWKKGTGEGKRK